MADIINRAFVNALQTYQQSHGQEVTYRLEELLGFNVHSTQSQQQQQQAGTEHELLGAQSSADHHGAEAQHSSQADNTAALLGASSEMRPAESQQQAPKLDTPEHQLSCQPSSWPCSCNHKSIIRYTKEHLLQLQQQLSQSGNVQQASSTPTAHQSAQQPDNTAISQGPHDQQQEQYGHWRWDPAYYWDADAWNGQWYNQGTASTGAGWFAGTASHHWGPAVAATTANQPCIMPPPPPPPPPEPGYLAHPNAANAWHGQACCVCGKATQGCTAAAAPKPTKDPEAIKQSLLSHIPKDVVACPASLFAAQAAIEKAVAMTQLSDCTSHMPELVMAWFYAGYYAGRTSSAQGSGDSNGS